MRKITISFTTARSKFSPFAWIIRKLWGTEYSHTAIIFHTKSLSQNLVYHASAKGLNFMSPRVFEHYNIIIYEKDIEITDEAYSKIVEKAIYHAGEDYGILNAIGTGLAYLLWRIGLPKWNPFVDGREKWICSEWVGDVLNTAYPEFDIDLETVSPQDIYNIVNSIS